jgi:hypothetical protein
LRALLSQMLMRLIRKSPPEVDLAFFSQFSQLARVEARNSLL